MQPSLEHNLLHCFPLNFLRMPLGVHTTSPFLYFCWANERGVLEREEVEEEPTPEVGVGVWVGVVLDGGRLEEMLFISEPSKAGDGGGCGLAMVERCGGPTPRTTERWGEGGE